MGLLDSLKGKINEFQSSSEAYNNALAKCNIVQNLFEIPKLESKPISYELITDKNPNITEDKALLIQNLLPLNDIYLEIIYGKEVKTGKEYFIVPTTNFLWLISLHGYLNFKYDNLKVELIKKGLMSKVINLSTFIFEIMNTEEEVNNFINIINNTEYRTNLINEKINIYGNEEVYRTLNKIGSGISYDKEYNIRFYSKEVNKKYNITELENYELMVDNNVMQEKRLKQNARMTSSKNTCYEIKLRITPKDNNIFEIPILEKDPMNTMYQATSDTYIRNLEYARELMKKLDDINDELIYAKNKEV